MRDFTIKQSETESAAKNHYHTNFPPTSIVKNISDTRNDRTLLQRKANCACGGGCPRCQDQPLIQPKLTIGTPGDRYEQEADRVADEIIGTSSEPSALQHAPAQIQRRCSSCATDMGRLHDEEEKETVQTKEEPGQSPKLSEGTQSVSDLIRGGGEPLPEPARSFFEPRFNHDFSNVRVHSDSAAARSAQDMNAMAYTVGSDIVFGAGQYQPQTGEGRRLLAHELTHVVQQGHGSPSLQFQKLTAKEKKEDLKSYKFKTNKRLQDAFDNDPVLSYGESGDGVTLLEQALIDLGFKVPADKGKKKITPSGKFDDTTFTRVQLFQVKYGLTDKDGKADGKVGRKTLAKLDELRLDQEKTATTANKTRLTITNSIEAAREGLGLSRKPADIDQDFVGAVTDLQESNGFAKTGNLGDQEMELIVATVRKSNLLDAIILVIDFYDLFSLAGLSISKTDFVTKRLFLADDSGTDLSCCGPKDDFEANTLGGSNAPKGQEKGDPVRGSLGDPHICFCKKNMNSKAKEFNYFVRIIGHEMVHIKQHQTGSKSPDVYEFEAYYWEVCSTDKIKGYSSPTKRLSAVVNAIGTDGKGGYFASIPSTLLTTKHKDMKAELEKVRLAKGSGDCK